MFGFFRNKSKAPKPSAPSPRLQEEGFRKEFIAELEKGAHGEVNRVDAALVLRHSGAADLVQVLAALEDAKLYSLVQSADSLDQPLVVKHPGGYGVVALFSSPERAERTIQQFPEFAELLQMSFRDIIELLDERHGIVINPLYEVATFQLTPKQVAAFRKDLAARPGISPGSKSTALQRGALCTIEAGDGRFGVAKVLAADDHAVHIRVFANRWKHRPTLAEIEASELTLGKMDDKEVGTGMGHLPLSRQSFACWEAAVLKVVSVADNELEGYKLWKEAKGGLF